MERLDGARGDSGSAASGSPSFSWRKGWQCSRCGGDHTSRQRCPEEPVGRATPGGVDAEALIARLKQSDARSDLSRQGAHAPSAPRAYYAPSGPGASTYLARQRAGRGPLIAPAGGVQSAAVQWLSALVCTAVVITCLVVAGVYIAHSAEAGPDPAVQVAGALIAIAIGLVAGALPLYVSARAYAGPAYALLALTLVTAGLIMMTIAPIVRQMNTPGLAEYRGFQSLLTFGIASVACGGVLGAVCVRWSLYPQSRERLARWSRAGAAAFGALLIVLAALMALTFPIAISSDSNEGIDQDVTQNAIIVSALIVLTVGPGVVLLWQGIAAVRGWRSREMLMPVALLVAACFASVLGVGHLNMRTSTPVAAPMPILHVLGAALPGLAYAALASRGSLLSGAVVRGLTWRQVSVAAAISLSVAVAFALYVEALGSTIAVTMLLVNSGAFEFAESGGQVWDIIFEYSDFTLTEKEQLVANLIAASLLAPVAEEFAKSLGVRFLMTPSTTRAQCFVLGAVAGAAFGFLEALMYGAGWIADDLGLWWQGITVRAGSTSGHVLWTGLTGVAWWYWSRARRHRLAVMLFGAAMLGHAAWNGVFTLVDSRIFFLDELSNRTVEVIAYVMVGIWSLTEISAIPIVARRLRDMAAAPAERTPLASMQAWLG